MNVLKCITINKPDSKPSNTDDFVENSDFKLSFNPLNPGPPPGRSYQGRPISLQPDGIRT